MGTAATATKVHMGDAAGGKFEGVFTLALDTTDANGLQTVDLTDYFSYVYAAWIGGELEATKTGYVMKVYKPAAATALTSTNLYVGFYESAGDGDQLDPYASTDISAVITGLTIVVQGKQAT
jgi:hypothetical protein